MSVKPPLTAAEVPPDWPQMVGEILRRNGQPMRAHSTRPMIEIKSMRTNAWLPLMLSNSGMLFTDAGERDVVMRRIEHG